jgi:hypothetical protein
MRGAHISLSLLLALSVSPALWAAPPADDRAGAATFLPPGAYRVSIDVSLHGNSGQNAVIACRARLAIEQPDTAEPVVLQGRTVASGQTAQCVIEIPFAWSGTRLGRSPGSLVPLVFEVAALRPGQPAELRQNRIDLPSPAPGTTSLLNLNVAF